MEAYVLWSLKNSQKYWQSWMKLEDEYGEGKEFKPATKEQKDNLTAEQIAAGSGHFQDPKNPKIIRFYGPDYETLWTNPSAGSDVFGGVTKDGKQEFMTILQEVRAAHCLDFDETLATEQFVLDEVRKRNGVTGTNNQASDARKEKRTVHDAGLDWDALYEYDDVEVPV
jgi:hypothetical protein